MSLFSEALLDDQHPVKMAAAEFAANQLAYPGTDQFDQVRWLKCAEFGVQGLMIPTEYGGAGRSAVEGALTFEGLGLGTSDNGFVFALSSQSFAMQRALVTAGSEEQRRHWLPKLAAGSAIGCFAMSEPEAGSDTGAITTTATLNPDGTYSLNGAKAWVTLSPVADVIVVFATTDPSKGHWGITAFILETDRAGISVGPLQPKMGLNTCPFAEVTFTDCRVGGTDLLGNVGAGGSVFSGAVEAERAFLYAAQMGSMERVINLSIQRARSRQAYGQPIGKFQGISHKIAEMKLRHESARLLIYKAAELYDRGGSMTMAGALAKLQTSEMAVQSALDAMRIHGAAGYTSEAGVEAELRDAIGGLSYSGTSEIARNLIARMLRVDRPIRTARPSKPPEV
ncbi:MAG: acyl-CoA dehydrogenase [Acidimicrobiales bacterium]|nr:acyl-CoA dehydrogenase [Acidimicrobiales bacterium]